MSTTSGSQPLRAVDGLLAVGGLADDRDVVLGLEHHPKARAHERLVVGDEDADAHVEQRQRRAHDEAALRPAARVQLAAVQRDALAHADEALAAAVRARSPRRRRARGGRRRRRSRARPRRRA